MSRHKGRDYLYVIWKDPSTGSRVKIGQLSKNGSYEFIYINDDLVKAINKGFKALVAFPEFDKVYRNDEVFSAFSSRLPDKRRKDIEAILSKYNLKEYDAFELLRASGGKLPTDTLEFIDPIFDDPDKDVIREFFIAGTRHRDLCKPEFYPECVINLELKEGEELIVHPEWDNEVDPNAVLLLKNSKDREKIGYIPAYYAESVSEAIKRNQKITCKVKSFLKANCQECVKVVLTIQK